MICLLYSHIKETAELIAAGIMTIKTASDTHFTLQVKNILDKLYGRSVLKDSLLDQAISYFENQPFNQHKLMQLKQNIDELKNEKNSEKINTKIEQLEKEYKDFKHELRKRGEKFLINKAKAVEVL